jgi:hypothetical protein
MTEKEKRIFESDLKESSKLLNQVDSYKRIIQRLEYDTNVKLNEDYFANLVPRFREISTTSIYQAQSLAAYSMNAAALLVIVIIVLFGFIRVQESSTINDVIVSLDNSEAEQLFKYYSDLSQLSIEQMNGSRDTLVTELLASELNFQEEDAKSLISSDEIEIENIYNELQPDETDLIYSELINTKYF